MSRIPRILFAVSLLALAALACSLLPSAEDATPTVAQVEAPQSNIAEDFGLGTQAEVAAYFQSDSLLYLEDFAAESYTQEEYNTPGTLQFTVENPSGNEVLIESSWCTDTLELALDDWQYMENTFTINGQEAASQHIFFDQWEPEDGSGCVSDSILITQWPSGEHVFELRIHQTEDLGDVPAGDYIWHYTVSIP